MECLWRMKPTSSGPPKPACLRCKQLKVRCEQHDGEVGFRLGATCVRCFKAGVLCEAAPPSRQGKRSHSPEKEKAKAAKMAIPVTGDTITKAGLPGAPAEVIRGLMLNSAPRSMMRILLREWAAISLARNGYSLMEGTLHLGKEHGFSTSELIGGVERLLLPFGPPPPPLAQLLASSDQPCCVRRHVPSADGELVVHSNDAFAQQVIALEGPPAHIRTDLTPLRPDVPH